MTPTWKGTPILKTCFDPKRDEYHLLDDNNDIVDTLSRHAFLSQPQLNRLPNGRYRRTHTTYNSSPVNLSGLARVRSLDWLYPDADMMGREAIVLADLRRTYDV